MNIYHLTLIIRTETDNNLCLIHVSDPQRTSIYLTNP